MFSKWSPSPNSARGSIKTETIDGSHREGTSVSGYNPILIAQIVIQELEKEMSKAVGVHPMAIKDIVKDLREENLIEEEKIGASSFYWCLESKIMNNLVAKEKKLQSDIDLLDKEIGIQNQLYEGTNPTCLYSQTKIDL